MTDRVCVGCGADLTGRRPNVVRCRKNCGRRQSTSTANGARSKRRAANVRSFVGIDGEGVDRPDGAHDYNLLSIGEEALYHPDGRKLELLEIWSFLWRHHLAHPGTIYVGFFLGYDFSQWLRQLPDDRGAMLYTQAGQAARQRKNSHGNPVPFPVRWKGWEFDLMPNGKRFKLRRQGSGEPWLYVCDAGSFFQKSLLAVIDEWPDLCDDAEQSVIELGKARRAGGVVPYGTPVDPFTIEYNGIENRVLARIMTHLNEGFVGFGVKLTKKQWFGPGQAAQQWLSHVADGHQGRYVREVTPLPVLDAARSTYFGGWFEIFAHGLVPGDTFEYDINSAYPHHIARLPCLLHGTWEHGEGAAPEGPWVMVYARVEGDDPIVGAMPHRTPQGSILRPQRTEGWYWAHELAAAATAGLVGSIEPVEWWSYTPCHCPPPFQAIEALYLRRIEVGKNSPQGKAMKLVYNSTYGKTAQSIGTPVWANSIYASLITAGCRTQITEAIGSHPDGTEAVVMVATDGVYFRTPHPGLDLDAERLGAWDAGRKSNLTLFKPGLYWDDKSRANIAAGAQSLGVKTRGVSQKAFAHFVGALDEQWTDETFTMAAQIDTSLLAMWDLKWPQVRVRIPFNVITPTQALARKNWALAGYVEHDRTSLQSADPSQKRAMGPNPVGDDLIRTLPHPVAGDGVSTPYDKQFGLDLEEMNDLNRILMFDGTFIMDMKEVLGLA